MADTNILRPSSLAHVVFRTANIKPMVEFWTTFLGAERVFEDDFIAFLRYDEEHHRVAIINEKDTLPKGQPTAGLHHVAFSFSSLRELLQAWQMRESLGIKPTWCINHGPTTSIYYKDPDGNGIETQIDNYDTIEEANEFMTGKYFRENPIGTEFDPIDLLARLDNGADERALKIRPEIGARTGVPAGV